MVEGASSYGQNMSQNLYQLFQDADKVKTSLGDEFIATEDVLLALFDQPYNVITKYLTDNGLTEKKFRKVVDKARGGRRSPRRRPKTPTRRWKSTAPTWSKRRAPARWTQSSAAMKRSAT